MYAVQVCMPGKPYTTITKLTGNLSAKMDVYLSILRGTHKLSRKGMTVRVVREETDSARINQTGMWNVIKRVRIAA